MEGLNSRSQGWHWLLGTLGKETVAALLRSLYHEGTKVKNKVTKDPQVVQQEASINVVSS
jgi:hypothetical protein